MLFQRAIPPGATTGLTLDYVSTTLTNVPHPSFAIDLVAPAVVSVDAIPLLIRRVETLTNGWMRLEFDAVPGRTYNIEYSSDLVAWQQVTPPLVAGASRVQWTDSGPPQTPSPPSAGNRYYRVVRPN